MAFGYVAPLGKFIAFTNVAPGALAGGKVYTYETGTSVPTPTWADQALTVPNSNPVLLDSAGRASIFIADASVMVYTFVVKDKNDVVVYSEHGISVPAAQTPAAPGEPVAAGGVPPGTILLYAGASAPTSKSDNGQGVQIFDYVLCDGNSWSRVDYARLFAITGTAFGVGDGSSTFVVPDLRQRFPLGLGTVGLGATRGAVGGEWDHRHSGPSHVHAIPAHKHSMAHTHGVSRAGWGATPRYPAQSGVMQTGADPGNPNASEQTVTQATQDVNTGGPSVTDTGDQAQSNTLPEGTEQTGPNNPPFQVVNYIIKT